MQHKFYKYKGYQKKLYSFSNLIYKNIKFDSKTEIKYYKFLEENSHIIKFDYKPHNIVYMDFKCNLTNQNIKRTYKPDFIVYYKSKIEIIDVKGGFEPAEWLIRQDAILQAIHYNKNVLNNALDPKFKTIKKIFFKSLTVNKDGKWISIKDLKKEKNKYNKAKRKYMKLAVVKILQEITFWYKKVKKTQNWIEPDYITLILKYKKTTKWKGYRYKTYQKHKKLIQDIYKLNINIQNLKTKKAKIKNCNLVLKKVSILINKPIIILKEKE